MPPTDEFGYHEVVHTAHIMNCNWEEFINSHPVVQENPELLAQSEMIGDMLMNFYQKVAIRSFIKFHEDKNK